MCNKMQDMNKDLMYLYPVMFLKTIFIACSDLLEDNPRELEGNRMVLVG